MVAGLLFFNFGALYDSFFYILSLSFSGYIMGIAKVAYHDPRPYWERDAIHANGCSRGYGNPSGHSMSIAIVTFLTLLIYQGYSAQFKHRRLYFALLLILAIALTILIGFSRLYLGVHSFDQILYGWQWGLWFAFFYYYIFYELIKYSI